MKPLLFVVFWLSILLVLLLGFGVAVGFVLHWLMPAIDLGIGALIGVIAVVYALDLFSKLMHVMARGRNAEFDDELDETEEGDEEQPEEPELRLRDVEYLLNKAVAMRRRKRGRKR